MTDSKCPIETGFISASGRTGFQLDWKLHQLSQYLDNRLKTEDFQGDYMDRWNFYNRVYHIQKRGWEHAEDKLLEELWAFDV
jgi:hypothetical protein